MSKKLHQALMLYLTLGVLVAMTSTSWAAQATVPSYELGEIVVSAESNETEKVATLYTLDATTLKDRGVRTLEDALVLVPGVYVRYGADGVPRIDIRGFRTRHVLFLLNGIPLNSTYDGQFDPRTVPVEIIEQIKVTTGGGSVLYGSGGNGGIINIIAKQGQPGLHGSIVAEIGQEDSALGRLSLVGGTEKVHAFASVGRIDRDGTPLSNHFSPTKAEDGDERDNSDFEQTNVFTNLDVQVTDRTLVGLTVNYQEGEYGKPAVTNYDKNDPFTKKEKFLRVDDSEGMSSQLAFSHKATDRFTVRGWGFYNELELEENRYDDNTYSSQAKKGAYESNSTTRTTGGAIQLNADLQDAGGLSLAVSTQNDDWEDKGFEVDKNNVAVNYKNNEDVDQYNVALEYEVALGGKAGMVAGMGYHVQDRSSGGDEDAYSYLIGFHFDPVVGTRLKINHARKVRFPSIKQLYDIDSGNEDLDAEHTMHYELGVEQALPGKTLFSLTGFINDAKDFIEKDEVTEINKNADEYMFHGFEVALENEAIDDLLLRLSYSYLESEDRSSDSDIHQLQNRPRDRVTFESVYDTPWNMTAQASVQYVANQYSYDDDANQRRTPAFTLVDVKLTQKLLEEALELYVGVNNLFDEDYEQSYGFPQPGRYVYGGVEYHF
ncbi:TonB-dependent receptor plug domain-containing protein [uncultured Desulfuromonas sp.]|uniref:TonB-dependent receptor plug domain-containing protein n=1 Tax=uncultured Desulfuromonas sp. TaxID=181013 RepID=UPI002AAA943A|nr:TonB-dependent receptor plug domain-containing protein [uncultured Desulfuromonas sp.]